MSQSSSSPSSSSTSTSTTAASDQLRAARRRLLGAMLIVTAMVLGHRAIGQLQIVTIYEYFTSPTRIMAIRVVQGALLLLGMVFVFKPSKRIWPRGVELGAWGLTLGLMAVGGYGNALRHDLVAHDVPPLEFFCEALETSTDPLLGKGRLDELRAKVAELEEGDDAEALIAARRVLSTHLLRHNDTELAEEQLRLALRDAEAAQLPQQELNDLLTQMAVAALRGGELSHCLHTHNPDSCLFPIKDAGVWANPEAGRRAIESLTRVLENDPEDLRARWLINVASMAVGVYPDGVDPRFLLSPERLASEESLPAFVDVAPQKGIADFNIIGGAIMDDFDGDGRLDIVTSTYNPCSPMRYYHNAGDGNFVDWSDKANITEQLGGFNLLHADYDNDGDLDIYVVRGAWQLGRIARQRNSLLRNDGEDGFTDVSIEAGLAHRAYPAQAATWGDYDNDGNIDLYVGNEWYPSQLFHNNGDGTFDEVAEVAGVENVWGLPGPPNTKGATFGDYDNDGDLDLYVSNLNQPNHLYRNEGDGTFVDVAPQLGVDKERGQGVHTFTSWFFDANQDGWLDLFVGGYPPADLRVWASDFLDMPGPEDMEIKERQAIYLNDQNGGFIDATEDMRLFDVRFPMGANYGDIDSDGFLDIYLGTGSPPFEILVPNVMYRNHDGEYFTNVTTTTNTGHLQKGHAIAFGDYDGDGDQDIFAQTGGWYTADAFYNAMFENPGNDHHWLTLRLQGTTTNRAAIGARVRVTIREYGRSRDVYTWVTSGASFGANSLQQEIGLRDAEAIEQVEITWPTSDTTQVLTSVPLDSIVEVVEGVDELRVVHAG